MIQTERGVILEELAMNDDDPSDVVHEEFAAGAVLSPATRSGGPSGGTPDTINAVPRDAVWEHYAGTTAPRRSSSRRAASTTTRWSSRWTALRGDGGWTLDASGARRDPADPARRRWGRERRAVGPPCLVEQANVVIGGTGLAATTTAASRSPC